jgi:serine/threonine protein kinase
MLQDQQEQQLEFIAMEVCSKPVRDYLSENTSEADRQYRVTRVALGSLKGLFDMHKQGLLHRDMKPG